MYVVSGIIGLIVAYGLWKVKNWARVLAVVLCSWNSWMLGRDVFDVHHAKARGSTVSGKNC